jgi:hypothetical protein
MVSQKTRTRPPEARTRKASAASKKQQQPKASRPAKPAIRVASPRVAAPMVCLGMTAAEVKDIAGSPECIVFTSDQHVEWQFGAAGHDASGAPAVYVTTVTFEMGRAVRITERFGKPGVR